MKKVFSFVLGLSLALFLCGFGAKTQLKGEGTEASPYLIANAADLKNAVKLINGNDTAKQYSTAHYRLTADINWGNKKWNPIGSYTKGFKGVFDGNGHTISGLRIDYKDPLFGEKLTYIGFFAELEGKVCNLTISKSTVSSKSDTLHYCAVLVGLLKSGIVENCHTTDSVKVSSAMDSAGLVGFARKNSQIINCSNAASVHTTTNIGSAAGIVTHADCLVADCSNSGTITGVGDCSGIVSNANSGVSGCTNSGTVTSEKKYAAGITCHFDDGALNKNQSNAEVTMENCTNSGTITSKGDIAGGIAVSCRTGIVKNCENAGDVHAVSEAGGIFAYFQISPFGIPAPKFTVLDCTNSGSITLVSEIGHGTAGGICGTLYGSKDTEILFENCVNTGSVTVEGQKNVANITGPAGGIIGDGHVRSLQLKNCTNSGSIHGARIAGGIMGSVNVVNHDDVTDASFLAEGCINEGTVFVQDAGGLTEYLYAGGILGQRADLVLAGKDFAEVTFQNCSNTGSLEGSEGGAPLCADDLCASNKAVYK